MDTHPASGPGPGTWKEPDPRRRSNRGSGAQNGLGARQQRLRDACGLSRLNHFLALWSQAHTPPCNRRSRHRPRSRWAEGPAYRMLQDIREAHASLMTKDTSQAHNGPMRDASGHSLPGDNRGLWQQQVQLSRGQWRRDDAAGAVRSAGWWESVTVTWSPAPAPDRRPDVLPRALAAATDMIAPVLADAAVTSTRRLLQRRYQGPLAASLLRRQLVSAARELPPSDRTP